MLSLEVLFRKLLKQGKKKLKENLNFLFWEY